MTFTFMFTATNNGRGNEPAAMLDRRSHGTNICTGQGFVQVVRGGGRICWDGEAMRPRTCVLEPPGTRRTPLEAHAPTKELHALTVVGGAA